MKMKNVYYIVSFMMALAVFFGCIPDTRDANMPDSAVYFVDNAWRNGIQEVTMYDVQDKVELPVHVYSAGFKEESPVVTAKADESYIEYYNVVNEQSLKALPSDCWTITKNSATVANRKASFNVEFDAVKIFEFAQTNKLSFDDMKSYVASLKLESDLKIATYKDTASLGYYMVAPDMRAAAARVSATSLVEGSMVLTVELPFDNQWDFEYEVEFFKTDVEDAFTTAGNSIPAKYVFASKPADATIENEDVKTMAPGTSSVSYTINIPSATEWKKGTSTNYAFKVHSAKLNGKEISVENGTVAVVRNNNKSVYKDIPDANYQNTDLPADYFMKTLTGFGLEPYTRDQHLGFIWAAESVQTSEGAVTGPFDGKGQYWHSLYNNRGYGALNAIPCRVIVDLKEELSLNGFEVWRRHNNKVPREIEFYALEDASYVVSTAVLDYKDEDLTYLGKLELDKDVSEVCATTVDPISTRYLLVKFTKSDNKVVHCTEFVVWK